MHPNFSNIFTDIADGVFYFRLNNNLLTLEIQFGTDSVRYRLSGYYFGEKNASGDIWSRGSKVI